MEPRHIPNIITVLRIFLVAPVLYYLLQHRYSLALGLFLLAGLSDGLDGFLAKHYHWQSRLGSYLDPLADKLLLVSSFLCLTWQGLLPVWLTVAVVLRDMVILSGAIAYYCLLRPFDGEPHWASKVNTFFQLLLVVSVLFTLGVRALPDGLMMLQIVIVFVTSLVSGVIYVIVWGSRYWRESHPRP